MKALAKTMIRTGGWRRAPGGQAVTNISLP
jgi:hypothetical protein